MNKTFSFKEGNPESLDLDPPESVNLFIDDDVKDVNSSWLLNNIQKVLDELNLKQPIISIRVVTDVTMSNMHFAYMQIEGTTDVLTFNNSVNNKELSVDIAICVDVARRQIAKRSHSLNHELLLYVVHGILHCIGFNDSSNAEYKRMHKEEDRILTAIGVGSVWSDSLC